MGIGLNSGVGFRSNSKKVANTKKATMLGEEHIRAFISLYTKGDNYKIGQQDIPYFKGIINNSKHGSVPPEVNEYFANNNSSLSSDNLLIQTKKI